MPSGLQENIEAVYIHTKIREQILATPRGIIIEPHSVVLWYARVASICLV